MTQKDIKKNYKIAIVMQSPDLGGAETYMLSLIEHFIKQKTDVFLASNNEKFFIKAKRFPIKTFEIPFILDIIGNYRGLVKSTLLLPYALVFYSKLLKKFKNHHVDIILMSGFSEKLIVTFLSGFYDIPVLWIEYGRLETVFRRNFYLPKILYRWIQKKAKFIIVPSKNTYESLRTEAQVSSKKLLLMPLGIEINKRKGNIKKTKDKTIKNKLVIGNVSRLTTEKGQDYLIRAMPYIIERFPLTHLIIIGDGPDKDTYHQLIKKLSIEKYVTLTGYVKDLSEYYTLMDVFVFPTVWDLEGFGLVTPEAMSYKLPVVASNIGPVPEIVDNNKTGILVPSKDEKAIAEAVLKLLKDSRKRKEFGENGSKKVKQYYNIEENIKLIYKTIKASTEK
jgi:glycosyltransferase involved in cell wall biosynthesis